MLLVVEQTTQASMTTVEHCSKHGAVGLKNTKQATFYSDEGWTRNLFRRRLIANNFDDINKNAIPD